MEELEAEEEGGARTAMRSPESTLQSPTVEAAPPCGAAAAATSEPSPENATAVRGAERRPAAQEQRQRSLVEGGGGSELELPAFRDQSLSSPSVAPVVATASPRGE